MKKTKKPGKRAKDKGKAADNILFKPKHREPKDIRHPKVVRDSFTMPESDYAKLKALKARFMTHGMHVKKGELLRAGLHALERMDERQLLEILRNIERVKTGRPKQQSNTPIQESPVNSGKN